MNNEGKMSMQQQQQHCMSSGLNGLYGQQQHHQQHQPQQQQQQQLQPQHQPQYYQPSSHSSGTSEYGGGMPGSGQYSATHFQYGNNCPPHNGMSMQAMSVAPNNGTLKLISAFRVGLAWQHSIEYSGTDRFCGTTCFSLCGKQLDILPIAD